MRPSDSCWIHVWLGEGGGLVGQGGSKHPPHAASRAKLCLQICVSLPFRLRLHLGCCLPAVSFFLIVIVYRRRLRRSLQGRLAGVGRMEPSRHHCCHSPEVVCPTAVSWHTCLRRARARWCARNGPLVALLPSSMPGLRTPWLFTCACAQYQPSADFARHWGVPPGEPANKRNAAWLARYPPSYQVDGCCQRCNAYGEKARVGLAPSPPLWQP